MADKRKRGWQLESFLDSFIVELDKVQDTLSVKAVNRPLTYTVKDVAFDLHIFPDYDGKSLRFETAKPGEAGASKISIQLGSITDRQVRETTKNPITKDDLSIEELKEVDEDTKDSLRKIGVTSVTDLEKMEKKNIDIEKVSRKKVNYKNLANLINQARRKERTPVVSKVTRSNLGDKSTLSLKGKNLVLSHDFESFPAAIFNNKYAKILSASDREMQIQVDEAPPPRQSRQLSGELKVALDPYTFFKIELK
jgi:hypothetical protein